MEKNNVILMQLINYGKYTELLQEIPHIRCLDLAMIFYYYEKEEDFGHKVIVVTNHRLKQMGLTLEQLQKLAMQNTPRVLPISLCSMESMIRELSIETGLIDGNEELEPDGQFPIFILTNKERFLGAPCIFYPHALEAVSMSVGDNLYVLPSSIHECILLPAGCCDSRDALEKIVCDVNRTQVAEKEVLSNHVYFYDKTRNRLEL